MERMLLEMFQCISSDHPSSRTTCRMAAGHCSEQETMPVVLVDMHSLGKQIERREYAQPARIRNPSRKRDFRTELHLQKIDLICFSKVEMQRTTISKHCLTGYLD